MVFVLEHDLIVADVNVIHARMRKETMLLNMGDVSLDETPVKIIPKKYPISSFTGLIPVQLN
jgi:hypothetical protein